MKLRKILVFTFALCLAVGVMAVSASAAEIVASGACGADGDNVTWTLDDEGVLMISGEGLTYAWYVAPAGEDEFVKSSSFTGSTYSTEMSENRDSRQVYCVVKDKFGNTVKTNTVSLRMTASITKQPTSVIAAKGKTAKTTVKALGDGLTYTWYMKDAGASKFTKSSVKSASYSAKMSSKIDGRQVYCVIKDKYGNTVKTKTVKLFME